MVVHLNMIVKCFWIMIGTVIYNSQLQAKGKIVVKDGNVSKLTKITHPLDLNRTEIYRNDLEFGAIKRLKYYLLDQAVKETTTLFTNPKLSFTAKQSTFEDIFRAHGDLEKEQLGLITLQRMELNLIDAWLRVAAKKKKIIHSKSIHKEFHPRRKGPSIHGNRHIIEFLRKLTHRNTTIKKIVGKKSHGGRAKYSRKDLANGQRQNYFLSLAQHLNRTHHPPQNIPDMHRENYNGGIIDKTREANRNIKEKVKTSIRFDFLRELAALMNTSIHIKNASWVNSLGNPGSSMNMGQRMTSYAHARPNHGHVKQGKTTNRTDFLYDLVSHLTDSIMGRKQTHKKTMNRFVNNSRILPNKMINEIPNPRHVNKTATNHRKYSSKRGRQLATRIHKLLYYLAHKTHIKDGNATKRYSSLNINNNETDRLRDLSNISGIVSGIEFSNKHNYRVNKLNETGNLHRRSNHTTAKTFKTWQMNGLAKLIEFLGKTENKLLSNKVKKRTKGKANEIAKLIDFLSHRKGNKTLIHMKKAKTNASNHLDNILRLLARINKEDTMPHNRSRKNYVMPESYIETDDDNIGWSNENEEDGNDVTDNTFIRSAERSMYQSDILNNNNFLPELQPHSSPESLQFGDTPIEDDSLVDSDDARQGNAQNDIYSEYYKLKYKSKNTPGLVMDPAIPGYKSYHPTNKRIDDDDNNRLIDELEKGIYQKEEDKESEAEANEVEGEGTKRKDSDEDESNWFNEKQKDEDADTWFNDKRKDLDSYEANWLGDKAKNLDGENWLSEKGNDLEENNGLGADEIRESDDKESHSETEEYVGDKREVSDAFEGNEDDNYPLTQADIDKYEGDKQNVPYDVNWLKKLEKNIEV